MAQPKLPEIDQTVLDNSVQMGEGGRSLEAAVHYAPSGTPTFAPYFSSDKESSFSAQGEPWLSPEEVDEMLHFPPQGDLCLSSEEAEEMLNFFNTPSEALQPDMRPLHLTQEPGASNQKQVRRECLRAK